MYKPSWESLEQWGNYTCNRCVKAGDLYPKQVRKYKGKLVCKECFARLRK